MTDRLIELQMAPTCFPFTVGPRPKPPLSCALQGCTNCWELSPAVKFPKPGPVGGSQGNAERCAAPSQFLRRALKPRGN